MKKKTNSGFTLIEVIVSVLIIIALAGLLMPVFQRVKRNFAIQDSLSRLKQLHLVLSIYRQDYGGEGYARYDTPYAFYALGLPPWSYWWDPRKFGLDLEFWKSPCGADKTIFDTGIGGHFGLITYAAGLCYSPEALRSNDVYYRDYLATYRENAVAFLDMYCNPPGTVIGSPWTSKRGLAVLLSGQLVNRYKKGNAAFLFFYSEPPE
ncbi:MAG TPA: type II secretion system protein [Fimbriimonadales bacterium]|nr:type II secretion system protein [Fimbriimonadales bacterium]